MSVCEEIQSRAVYLVALASSEPERLAASAHVQACAACRKALQEGAQLISLLDAIPLPAAPSVEVLARASSTILAELDASAKKSRGSVAPWLGASIFISCLGFSLVSPNPGIALWPWALAGVLLLSLLSGLLTRAWWGLGLFIGGSVLLSVSHSGPVPTQGAGLFCLWIEQSMALLPIITSLYLVAKGHTPGGGAYFAGAAAAGALAGQAAMLLACPNNNIAHLLLAHTGGVLFAAALGALISKLWSRSPALSA
jgi:predicted anti-sigma-YlaC factor YlaD